ncbi:MAG TPA: RIO1 family regulatory kinase/ATPase [Pseudonocardiaceae bacterium]
MRDHDDDPVRVTRAVRPERAGRRRRARFDDDPADRSQRRFADKRRALATPLLAEPDDPELPDGQRRSTWDGAIHGPEPRPGWVITEDAAVDVELGVLKTGKEADVHLVLRRLPAGGRETVMAAKRYRGSRHRLFHRDGGYLEGRRVRRSREQRAVARRSTFGRDVIAAQWAVAEFEALARLWSAGVDVPYPVQLAGTELLMEFVGGPDLTAAPRLAGLRPGPAELRDLWQQLTGTLVALAGEGLAHGDLSPYNALVHDGRLVLIDLPQVVDVVANPNGVGFLRRDVTVMSTWFAARGLPPELADPEPLLELLLAEARLRP